MFRVPLRRFIDEFVYFKRAIALDLIQILKVFVLPIKSFQLEELEIFIQQINLHLSKGFSAKGALRGVTDGCDHFLWLITFEVVLVHIENGSAEVSLSLCQEELALIAVSVLGQR